MEQKRPFTTGVNSEITRIPNMDDYVNIKESVFKRIEGKIPDYRKTKTVDL